MLQQLCALCGENPATTVDHIPPRGIYLKAKFKRQELHFVPTCPSCNNKGSVDDEAFKVFIGLETGEFQDDPKKVLKSIARTVASNRKFLKPIFESKRVYAQLRGPIFERAVVVPFDGEFYRLEISRIIRGLYWRQTGKSLGKNTQIGVYPTQNMTKSCRFNMTKTFRLLPAHTLNKGTFVYRFHFFEDGTSIWAIEFFGRHTVFGFAEAPEA